MDVADIKDEQEWSNVVEGREEEWVVFGCRNHKMNNATKYKSHTSDKNQRVQKKKIH